MNVIFIIPASNVQIDRQLKTRKVVEIKKTTTTVWKVKEKDVTRQVVISIQIIYPLRVVTGI